MDPCRTTANNVKIGCMFHLFTRVAANSNFTICAQIVNTQIVTYYSHQRE